MVESSDGVTAIFGDSLFNVPHQKGMFGYFYGKLMGNFGSPKVTFIAKNMMRLTGILANYKDWLAAKSSEGEVVRLIPGHGDVIDKDVSEVLSSIASTL